MVLDTDITLCCVVHNLYLHPQPRVEEPGGTEVSYAGISAGHGHCSGTTLDIYLWYGQIRLLITWPSLSVLPGILLPSPWCQARPSAESLFNDEHRVESSSEPDNCLVHQCLLVPAGPGKGGPGKGQFSIQFQSNLNSYTSISISGLLVASPPHPRLHCCLQLGTGQPDMGCCHRGVASQLKGLDPHSCQSHFQHLLVPCHQNVPGLAGGCNSKKPASNPVLSVCKCNWYRLLLL